MTSLIFAIVSFFLKSDRKYTSLWTTSLCTFYVGAYQDKPRGRVFYNINTDTYEVAVGKWLEEYPQAYDLILEEFNLPKEKTAAKYAIHWDIGMSWR